MKITLLYLPLSFFIALTTLQARPGGWILDILANKPHQECHEHGYGYAYAMGSNFNNGRGPHPVYPVKEVYYTPWVRNYSPVPSCYLNNPRVEIRYYGEFYDMRYINYKY